MTVIIQTPRARTLFTIAEEDQGVLSLPLPDRLFGFCAQQSCEKMFKALLAAHGQSFPFTHQLFELTAKLEFVCGEKMPVTPFLLADIQAYVVQLRYEDGPPLSATQRIEIRETVAILRAHILERILKAEQAAKP